MSTCSQPTLSPPAASEPYGLADRGRPGWPGWWPRLHNVQSLALPQALSLPCASPTASPIALQYGVGLATAPGPSLKGAFLGPPQTD